MHVSVFKMKDRKNYVAQWTDPVTGKKKTRSTGTTIRRDAERFAARLENDIEQGNLANERLTWETFRDRFEDIGLSGKRKTTQAELRTTLNMVEKYVDPSRPAVITTAVVSSFAMKLRTEQNCREMTVKKHLSGLRTIMNWAKSHGYIKVVPKFTMPRCTGMKGRPITGEEFERMLKAVDQVPTISNGETYRFLLRGLWLSGLRISEAIKLSWDSTAGVRVNLDGRRPMIDFAGNYQKNGKDQLIPITPDFFGLLMTVPEEMRAGSVFGIDHTSLHVSKQIAKVGKQARVITAQDGDKKVYASAHDLRRSFGYRWARKIPAHDLQLLMRHADIKTTLRFYVGQRSDDAGDAVWGAEASSANSLNNREQEPEKQA